MALDISEYAKFNNRIYMMSMKQVNPLVPNAPFLYLLKPSENIKVSG